MGFSFKINGLYNDFISLIFPNHCLCCLNNLYKSEELICISCLLDLPKTHLHLKPDNILEKRFWGKVHIERVSAYLYYTKQSKVQMLLEHLKYSGGHEIGVLLGKHAAAEIAGSDFVAPLDMIVPVPLHPKKLAKRGYNQSLCIAEGMATILNLPIDDKNLFRAIENPTQTKRSTYERWQNTKGIFDVIDGTAFDNKHILLIDDVLTTGSTLIACAEAIAAKSNAKISIFTLASA